MIISKRWLKKPKLTFQNLLVLHLNKLESPSSKDALCQVWLKLAQWFWRRGFFNFVNVFSLFLYNLPLEKDRALHLNKVESGKDRVNSGICQKKCNYHRGKKITRWYMYYVNDQKVRIPWRSPLSKHGLGMQMRRLFNSVHRISDMKNSEIQKMELDMRLFNLVILNYLGFCLHPKFRTRSTFLAKSGLIVCQRT